MKIAIGCDHAACEYKAMVKDYLLENGYEVVDEGIEKGEKADYPDIAEQVGQRVASGECEKGILICGTGIGMSIAANKVDGVRAAAVSEPYSARLCRAHNDANILCFGQRVVGSEVALELVKAFLSTAHEGGRHTGRVAKIMAIEERRK